MGRLWRRCAANMRHRRMATGSIVSIQINLLAERESTRYNSVSLWTSALIHGFGPFLFGAIAKLLMPGRDPGGCIITILLGIAGAFVGTWIGRVFAGGNYVAGWIMSVIGAMVLLLLYRFLFKRGA